MRHGTAALLTDGAGTWRSEAALLLFRGKYSQSLLAMSLALALGGCAVTTPPTIDATGGPIAAGRSIVLSEPDDTNHSEELHQALGKAFDRRGYSVGASGDYQIEYSITERSAVVGMAHEADVDSNEEPDIVSAEREKRRLFADRLFAECEPKRMRIVLVAYPNTESGNIHRASGEMDECAFTQSNVELIVEAMIEKLSDD